MISESSYKRLCKDKIIENLKIGPRSFEQLLISFQSVFPDELHLILKELIIEDKIETNDNIVYFQKAKKIKGEFTRYEKALELTQLLLEELHLPHSLDYEWWFDINCLIELYEETFEKTQYKTNSVTFLGAPILGFFTAHANPNIKVTILDVSKNMISTIKKIVFTPNLYTCVYNVEHELPNTLLNKSDFVFCDPPWYLDYFKVFLKRSILLASKLQSILVFSIFPVFTRASAGNELIEFFSIISKHGLLPIKLIPGITKYQTPPFEHLYHSSKGFDYINWRSGDLLFLLNVNCNEENDSLIIEKFKWLTLAIESIIIKLKIADSPIDSFPKILHIYEKEHFANSVSRHNIIRDEIDIWFSNNIGLKVTNIWYFMKILIAIKLNINEENLFKYFERQTEFQYSKLKLNSDFQILKKLLLSDKDYLFDYKEGLNFENNPKG